MKTHGNYGKLWCERYGADRELYKRFSMDKYIQISNYLGKSGVLLDVGCGFGDALYHFQDKFDDLIGIDPSSEMIDICAYNIKHRNIRARVAQGMCESLNFSNHTFNTVMLLDVFEHFHADSLSKALSEINRVLRTKGELIIVTPSRSMIKFWSYFDNTLVKLLVNRKRSIFSLPKKKHTEIFYSKKEVIDFVRYQGFTLKKFKRISFYPAPERLGVLNRIWRRVYRFKFVRSFVKGLFVLAESIPFLRQKMFFVFVKS